VSQRYDRQFRITHTLKKKYWYIRLLELASSVYGLVAIIKKRLKIDVSFYTILQIPSLIIFDVN